MTAVLITRGVDIPRGGIICPKRPTKIGALTRPKKPEKARRLEFMSILMKRLSRVCRKKASTSLNYSTSLGGSAL
ncbi:hypothetical protein [Thermococcus sp.]|uniref:hypothetical protein n=1 Tax=Thermococcus sp. TaxID=35749 RepID=UPI0025F4FCFF|nr:hypothetical protein [Thermococcus sp.]